MSNPHLVWRARHNPQGHNLTDVIAGIPERFQAGVIDYYSPRMLTQDIACFCHKILGFFERK